MPGVGSNPGLAVPIGMGMALYEAIVTSVPVLLATLAFGPGLTVEAALLTKNTQSSGEQA